MANTYTQIHIQAIFAVQNRYCLIDKKWEDKLYKYITGIIQKYDHKLLQINGVSDHIHILIGMRPKQSLSELMKNARKVPQSGLTTGGFYAIIFRGRKGLVGFRTLNHKCQR